MRSRRTRGGRARSSRETSSATPSAQFEHGVVGATLNTASISTAVSIVDPLAPADQLDSHPRWTPRAGFG
jgi:hypothetical protein